MPSSPPAFLTHSYTHIQTVLWIILYVPHPVLVGLCPYLTTLSVYLAINRPQGRRLSVCGIKMLGEAISVCRLLLLEKLAFFFACETENIARNLLDI